MNRRSKLKTPTVPATSKIKTSRNSLSNRLSLNQATTPIVRHSFSPLKKKMLRVYRDRDLVRSLHLKVESLESQLKTRLCENQKLQEKSGLFCDLQKVLRTIQSENETLRNRGPEIPVTNPLEELMKSLQKQIRSFLN